jgi:hypothetical protein
MKEDFFTRVYVSKSNKVVASLIKANVWLAAMIYKINKVSRPLEKPIVINLHYPSLIGGPVDLFVLRAVDPPPAHRR